MTWIRPARSNDKPTVGKVNELKKLISVLVMCLILSLSLLPIIQAADTVTVDQFKDLKDLPKDQKDKFDSLIKGGVFSGLSEDTFGLDSQMNRAQFAKVAAIIFSLPIDANAKSSFTDISSGHWSLSYVEALKKAGLTNGYDAEGKTYNPDGVVSRQELAAFLIRGLGIDDQAQKATPVKDSSVDDWAKGYVSLALEKKLLANQDDGSFGGKSSATRRMLVLASYEAKKLFADKGTGAATPTPAPTVAPGAPTPVPTVTPATPTESPKPQTEAVSFKGKKAVVTGDVQPGKGTMREEEQPIINRLTDLGFTVDQLPSTKIVDASFDGYDLVVIGGSTNSKYSIASAAKFKSLSVPVLYNKREAFAASGFSKLMDRSYIVKLTQATIVKSDHPIAAGIKGEFKAVYEPNTLNFVVPDGDAIVVATIQDSKGFVVAYEKGTKNAFGEKVAARVVNFPLELGKPLVDYATPEMWKIFDASVAWLMANPK